VYTFDYRYFGLSFPPPHRPSTFTPEERHMALLTAPPDIDISETWARLDLGGVVRYAAANAQSLRRERVPLIVMGHSMGGREILFICIMIHSVTNNIPFRDHDFA